jgi:two-component system chemotaxis response regulator CheY
MKSLVVDDEQINRRKMEKILGSVGQCTGAEKGIYALSAFLNGLDSKDPFDVVTLDISMPEMDGLQVLFEIREMEKEWRIPKEKRARIIMVTSKSDKDTIITALQAGCDDYVVKPFDRGIVMKKLQRLGVAVPAVALLSQSPTSLKDRSLIGS